MKNLKTQLAVLLLTTVCLFSSAYGQLTPIGDAYVNTSASTTNYGAKPVLDVEYPAQTTYIQFNLASIPSNYTGADIAQATLKLYVNGVTKAGTFNVDQVTGTWTESTIDASNAPGGTAIPSATNVPVTTTDINQYILVNVTTAVQAWLNGTPNDGVELIGNSPLVAIFDSKENTTTSHPPELDVVFVGGGTLTGITTASGSGLIGGGTSGTLNLSLTDACAVNQVLQWNGTAWVCASAGTGTITSVTAGTGLTGGGTSGNVTLGLASNACASGSALSALPFTCSPFATLGANTFTANQTVNGNVSANGFQIGSNLFAFGNYADENALLGFSGNSTITGVGNTASGVEALFDDTTGNANTASGFDALLFNTSGGGNTAVGSYALSSNTTGGSNTALGFIAGAAADGSRVTGNLNTAVGDNALFGTGSLTNATAIGADAEVTESNALVLGSINGVNGAGASVNVGIGTTAPAYSLDVHGTGNFTGAVTFAAGQTFPGTGTITGVSGTNGITGGGTSGSVTLSLVSNSCASGSALTGLPFTCSPFATLGANTFTANQTVNGNLTATGVVTGSSFQIGSNLFAFGNYSNGDAFLGFAGNSSGAGAGNTGSGSGALVAITSGSSNTANGFFALNSNTTGSDNTAIGADALQENVGGSENTATGNGTLSRNSGTENTASGYQALRSNMGGSYNTASGAEALYENTTGDFNVALGFYAGQTTDGSGVTGNGNTAIGAGAAFGTGSISNATALGNNAVATESNTLVLGCIAPNNNCPTTTSIGIGTTTPDNLLSVNGSADKPGGGSWGTYSDGRLKNVNGTFGSGLSQILRINPIRYRYKPDNAMGIRDTEEHIGVVAQDVQRIIPEAVTENSKGYLLVNNDPVIWSMVNAIKEQQRQITQQQNLLREQSAAMQSLKAEVRATRESLRKVKAQVAAAQLTTVAEK